MKHILATLVIPNQFYLLPFFFLLALTIIQIIRIIVRMAQNENERLDLNFLGNNKLQTESTFSILNEGSDSQILQISMPPNCSNFIRGRIIYTNTNDQALPTFTSALSWKYLFRRGIHMDLWRNRTQQMQIVGLKHVRNRGPILILDLFVYKQSFYISLDHIVASKYSLQSSISLHPALSMYQLVEFKEKVASLEDFFKNNQKIALQGSSTIIEKCLAPGEPFSLHSGAILALSKSMQVQKARNTTKLLGPGWVFFEASPRELNLQSKMRVMLSSIIVYCLLMAMLLLF